jgi:hypothetical protein
MAYHNHLMRKAIVTSQRRFAGKLSFDCKRRMKNGKTRAHSVKLMEADKCVHKKKCSKYAKNFTYILAQLRHTHGLIFEMTIYYHFAFSSPLSLSLFAREKLSKNFHVTRVLV